MWFYIEILGLLQYIYVYVSFGCWTKAKPTFGGKVGTTKKDFNMAGEKYVKAFEKYLDEMTKNSAKLTDDVGYTKSEYDKNGPRE